MQSDGVAFVSSVAAFIVVPMQSKLISDNVY